MNQFTSANYQSTETYSSSDFWSLSNLNSTQQVQYGGMAMAGIIAVTLLIRSLTELVKACHQK